MYEDNTDFREKKNSLTGQREFEDAGGGEGYRLRWKGVM